MRSVLSICAIVALTLAISGTAWGPAAHYYFTCKAVRGNPLCMNEGKNWDLLSGTEMPDSLIFGDMVSGNPCTGFGMLHNLYFAGFQLQLALKEARENNTCYSTLPGVKNSDSCFSAVDFALGFGAHVVADIAAFFSNDAYLGDGYKPSTPSSVAGEKNWISIWPFMTAVDAYVRQTKLGVGSRIPDTLHNLPSNATEFLVRANAAFAAAFPTEPIPAPTAAEFGECANQWHYVIENEGRKAASLPNASYQWEMVYNDRMGATNFSDAAANFEKASWCTQYPIDVWMGIVLGGESPILAFNTTLQWYVEAFQQGLCSKNPISPPKEKPSSRKWLF